MENKYVSNIEGVCPKCGKTELNYDSAEFDLPFFIIYPYVCEVCGCRGLEYHKLSFDGHSVHNDEIDDLEDVNEYIPID